MNKLDMKSMDIVKNKIDKIAELFPNVIVESEIGRAIDYDLLKQELSNEIVEGNKEKYQLTWPGKKEAIVNTNTRTTNTLRPLKDKSVDFENTKNIYIEGDNLEALKILQESYLNKIKCIYIDPPYNTGNDFIYNDYFTKGSREELIKSGQIDEEGYKLISNNSANGRFHSDWLSMMYSRLKLARTLLTKDGLIFISIDDNELYNLKKICDEIFGENNFINCISIKMSELSGVKMKHLSKYPKLKESLLIYAKDNNESKIIIEKNKKTSNSLTSYLRYYSNIIENIDDDIEKWNIIPLKEYFEKNNIDIDEIDINQWKIDNANRLVYRTNSRTITKFVENNPTAPFICKVINKDGNEVIKWDDKEMLFLEKYVEECLGDIWMDISTINLNKETDISVFENGQKPLMLMERIIKSIYTDKSAPFTVMDFFSGSATTAHAVMKLNSLDKGKRNFIMVQLDERCSENSEAYKNGYKTICDIGEERIRRAGKKIKEDTKADIDYGFRVYKIDSSNMNDIYYKPNELKQSQLNLFESNIKEGRTTDDLLTQAILDLGLTLDLRIEEKQILNNKVYYVDNNSLVACFDNEVNISIVDEICKCKPSKVVFKDDAFKYDNDKINLQERFKKLSPDTKISIL